MGSQIQDDRVHLAIFFHLSRVLLQITILF